MNNNNYTITVDTGPTLEPVTAAQVKLQTHISHTVEDDLIDIWIKAARVQAENFQQRAYNTQTLILAMDTWPKSAAFYLPRAPLISVTTIEYYDVDDTAATFSSGDYQVITKGEPGRIALNYAEIWPTTTLRPANGIIVTFKAGYGTTAASVPAPVRAAILMYCAYMNENRAGEVQNLPNQVLDLLRPDRLKLSQLEV